MPSSVEQLKRQAEAIAVAERRLENARRRRDADTKRELPTLVLELMLEQSFDPAELVERLERQHLLASERDVTGVLELLVDRGQVQRVGNRYAIGRPGVLSQQLAETPRAPKVR